MSRVIAVMMLAVCLATRGRLHHEDHSHVVLPSPKLIGCQASGCSQMCSDDAADSSAIYPQNPSIDIEEKCVLGIVARTISQHPSTPSGPLSIITMGNGFFLRTTVDQPHYGASSLIEWRFNCLKTMMGLKKSSIYLRALGCLSKGKTRLEQLSENPQVLRRDDHR